VPEAPPWLRWRSGLFALAAALALALAAAYGQVTDHFAAAPDARTALFIAMGGLLFALVFLWPRLPGRGWEAALLLLIAALLRLAILPAAPSDDAYRYVWEGRLVLAGVSPYAAPADSPVYQDFHDATWERMNNRDKLTAYPPLSQYAFAALAATGGGARTFKAAFALLDLAVVALLLAWLARRRLPARWAGLYAFNPVALVAFAGEGHFDVLFILALAGGLFLLEARRLLWAAAAIGAAVQLKLVAVLLAPILWRRFGWRPLAAFAAVVLLPCLPFLPHLDTLLRGIFAFGTSRYFNGFVHLQLRELTGALPLANLAAAGILLTVLAWRFLRPARDPAVSDWLWLGGALLILSPTFHFWYLTWLLPFVALRPSLAWLAFCLTQGIYFQVWGRLDAGYGWSLSELQAALIWLPLLGLGAWELRHHMRFPRHRTAPASTPHSGIALIVPTLDAEAILPRCLASIARSSRAPDELIIADGGSTDATRRLAQAAGARLVPSQRGRGNQIAAGVRACRCRYVLVLHADCQLPPHALALIEDAFARNPGLAGGALGQRFDTESPVTLTVEFLNELRATLEGTAFGDQAQFFDRRLLPDAHLPAQPLMEDIELSLRLRERGPVLYLGQEVTASGGKWARRAGLRFQKVLYLVARYRLLRLLSPRRAAAYSARLYREYYSPAP